MYLLICDVAINYKLSTTYLRGRCSITDEEQPTPPNDEDFSEPLFPSAGFFFLTNSLTNKLTSPDPADRLLNSFFFLDATFSWTCAGLNEGPPL